MSAPAPLIVNVPDAYVALPPTAGLPMSVASHGEGRLKTAAFVNVAVARVESVVAGDGQTDVHGRRHRDGLTPDSVQLVPVVDRYAEKVEPLRTNRTQYGAVPVRRR